MATTGYGLGATLFIVIVGTAAWIGYRRFRR
jgi:hypothetical protein